MIRGGEGETSIVWSLARLKCVCVLVRRGSGGCKKASARTCTTGITQLRQRQRLRVKWLMMRACALMSLFANAIALKLMFAQSTSCARVERFVLLTVRSSYALLVNLSQSAGQNARTQRTHSIGSELRVQPECVSVHLVCGFSSSAQCA